MKIEDLIELGAVIDNACDNSDEQELNTIIIMLKDYVETSSNSEIKSYLYYLLSNSCWGLQEIKHNNQREIIWQYEQSELFNQIYYLRKAINENSFNTLEIGLQASILTNLGNAFNHYGRTINAIKYYNKALSLFPNHYMSLSNKAICLETYSNLTYDYSHKDFFLRYAYFDLTQANKEITIYLKHSKYDYKYYHNIKEANSISMHKIENILTKEWLNENIDLDEFELRKNKNERKYKNWVLGNTLFLNPMNDLGKYNIATQDILNLPNLISDIKKGFPKFITYFNQIKQEYITNRHLLYEGINCSTNCFFDKDTSITDDYDYNIYDINTEKIKLSFRGFYSLFDKIAYFLNEYLELGFRSGNVDFKKIWNNKNNKKTLNPKLQDLENIALRGLYLLSKDLFFNEDKDENFITALEPEAEIIAKIRNHLEHKFIMIKHLDIKKHEAFSERERSFYITEEEFIDKTINLAKLSREAIMYLSFAVYIQEGKKEDIEEYLNIQLSTKG